MSKPPCKEYEVVKISWLRDVLAKPARLVAYRPPKSPHELVADVTSGADPIGFVSKEPWLIMEKL